MDDYLQFSFITHSIKLQFRKRPNGVQDYRNLVLICVTSVLCQIVHELQQKNSYIKVDQFQVLFFSLYLNSITFHSFLLQ